ncbi:MULTISPECIES: DUF6319 family protein [Prauserella salsuginis group]|uniref:Mucin n=2 Tax=Prauserella salsuginis group TaxID=2893672 RepID=A0A839XTU2_9PSEU|nr:MULTISPECIES: DUF6319 family protein [Prauserella salsuginis group]MBB3663265.1 hypothetical protein [Prauserella sediminis]MCR3720908.1 hypothetical protein [Prauserella flava]MCR3735011.1 hypothetical protein [Prauserella salsuginis]
MNAEAATEATTEAAAGATISTTDEAVKTSLTSDNPGSEAAATPADSAEASAEAPNDTTSTGEQQAEAQPGEGQSADDAKPKRGRSKGTSARKTRTVELTLTVTGTADGEWQAELKHGSKWVTRGLAVTASAVSRAAKELHEQLSTPIDEVINAAKEQQQARVAELEAQLEEAKKQLAELEQ